MITLNLTTHALLEQPISMGSTSPIIAPVLISPLRAMEPVSVPVPAAERAASLSIRQADDTDYEGLSFIHNSIFPDLPLSSREIRFTDTSRDSRCVLQRWACQDSGKASGFAELTQSSETYHPTRFQFRLYVRPEFEGEGVVDALFERVLKAFREHRGASLRILVREGQNSLASRLEKSGFNPSMRFLDKILHLKELDRDLDEAPSGITVATLHELRSDPGCHRKLFDLENAVRQDVPHPDSPAMRFDYFERAILGHPGLLPEGYLVALEGGLYIGLCSLSRRDGNRIAYLGLTGILPGYRKKGIARHLKEASLRYARQAGFESVFTTNEEGNRAIGDLNEQLGFRVASSRTLWTKAF